MSDVWAERIATAFGVGRIPTAPGTFGSLVAALVAWPLAVNVPYWWAVAIPLAAGAGWLACPGACRRLGAQDPGAIVIDEIAGQWVALAGFAFDPWVWIAAFGLFRLFDVWKPWPVSRCERLPGASGIMTDDLVAGAMAFGILRAILAFTG